MKTYEQIELEAAELVAELFADNKSPMESFGITWGQVEMLERKEPGIVIKLPYNDDRRCVCCWSTHKAK